MLLLKDNSIIDIIDYYPCIIFYNKRSIKSKKKFENLNPKKKIIYIIYILLLINILIFNKTTFNTKYITNLYLLFNNIFFSQFFLYLYPKQYHFQV